MRTGEPAERTTALFLYTLTNERLLFLLGKCSDLKPENVLLVSKNEFDIKIADFGLSNILDDAAAMLATAW